VGRPPRQPIVWLCSACLAGVACDRLCSPSPLLWGGLACGAVAAWWVACGRRGGASGAALILIAWFAAAGLYHHGRWRMFAADDFGLCAGTNPVPVCVEGVALTNARYRPAARPDPLSTMVGEDLWELVVGIRRVRDGARWRTASGRMLLTVRRERPDIRPGEALRIFATLAAGRASLNPGESSAALYDRAERRLGHLWVDEPECVERIAGSDSWRVAAWMGWMREGMDRRLRRYIHPSRAGLASAVLIGMREQIDPELNDEFIATGTVHLLAISGMHLAILAYGFLVVVRLGVVNRRLALWGTSAFAVWYALLTDAGPPVVRASVLVVVMCLARIAGRQSLSFNTLAAGGVVVLAINPATLFHAGTQLSFLAVATIAGLPSVSRRAPVDPLQRLIDQSRPWWVRLPRRFAGAVWQSIVISFAVGLVSLPLVMYRFHIVSAIGIVLNPVVCPLMSEALFAGFGVILLGGIAPPLGAACGWLCDTSLGIMEWLIHLGLSVPGNHVWGPAPPGWWVVAFYVALAIGAAHAPLRPPTRWRWSLAAGWFALGFWLAYGPGARLRTGPPRLVCTFIAVGHGTSVLLEFPRGKSLLYDAGRLGLPATAGRPIASVLWSRGISHLDALVISHADADHFNAVPYLLDRFSVGRIYVSPGMFPGTQRAVAALEQELIRRRMPVRELAQGDQLFTNDSCDLRVLHPPPRKMPGSDNANSMVLVVDFAGRRLMLPGDLEAPGLERLLGFPRCDCDVLMAPHHGSARSDPAGFAAWSTPEWVIISSGRGRDSPVVREAYQTAGARVLQTASDGAVQVTIGDGFLEVDAWCSPASR
jgi:competence protein ComEC